MNVVGSQGYYWSSTPNGTSNGYNLWFNSGGFNPSNNNNRYLGFSVRCRFRCARSPSLYCPYYFPPAGFVYYDGGYMHVVGSQGRYWSSTERDSTYGYYLYFNGDGIYPSSGYYSARYYGLSVRCYVNGN